MLASVMPSVRKVKTAIAGLTRITRIERIMAKKVTQTIEISDTLWKVSTDKDDLDPFYVTGANGAEAFANGRKHILKLQEKAEDEYEYLLTRIIKVELMGDVFRYNEQKVYV